MPCAHSHNQCLVHKTTTTVGLHSRWKFYSWLSVLHMCSLQLPTVANWNLLTVRSHSVQFQYLVLCYSVPILSYNCFYACVEVIFSVANCAKVRHNCFLYTSYIEGSRAAVRLHWICVAVGTPARCVSDNAFHRNSKTVDVRRFVLDNTMIIFKNLRHMVVVML